MLTNNNFFFDVVRLIVMMLNGEKADVGSFQNVPQIMEAARSLSLEAMMVDALEYQGIRSRSNIERRAVIQRRCILYEDQLRQICDRLTENRIWHMPLKGSILKEFYPRFYHREMKDIDILCDPAKRAQIKDMMESLGFTSIRYQKANDDDYHKMPFLNVEMHFELFGVKPDSRFRDYYCDVYDRLVSKSNFEFEFSPEDMYIYMILHTYKHFIGAGVSIRYLLDSYLFLNRLSKQLDWCYIRCELDKLGVASYEESHRALAIKVFSGQSLTEQDYAELEPYLIYGTHGTQQRAIENELERSKGAHSKAGYVVKRLFPTGDELPGGYRFFREHKFILPALWVYRPLRAVVKYPAKIIHEMKLIRKV